ncbi:DUF624 domain-containing protein [Streptomyces odontomachi]|uniref:DUF624 domain-containing protein n=1 Tax=Streptomyces odontomachi TaxID=2944940 RepID=UPI00210B5892|nr:DUF624 domain-containing protein [Streptomyces sp. ODS25]
MSAAAGARREFGDGPLARAAAAIYTLLVTELLFLLASAPTLALVVLLDRDASNIPLAAVCALPVGPAWSAALYAWQRRGRSLTELRPVPAFWRGYRANAVDALKIWAPWLAGVAVVGTVLTHLGTAGIPGWWAVLLGLVALLSALWMTNALVIASLFSFRTSDTARLAAYFLVRCGRGTVGHVCVLLAAAALTVALSEAVPLLLAPVLAAGVLLNCRPMINEIQEKFVA